MVLWAAINFSHSSHLPRGLPAVCYFLGAARNLKLQQRLFEIFGCYSSVNKLKLCK